MSGGGFDSGFSRDMGGIGFNQGFSRKRLIEAGGGSLATVGALFSNFDTYIIDGVRALHGGTAGVGYPAFAGILSRVNITITSVLKVTSAVTVKGFKFVRTPESSSSWTTITGDDMDVVLTVKSGGTINGGAISTKTFATNSKVRSATRTSPFSVNALRNEYDIYTMYDANAVTLTEGTYRIVYRSVGTQIGLASFWTANVPIPTTTNIYPDPADSANATYYPVIEVLETAP